MYDPRYQQQHVELVCPVVLLLINVITRRSFEGDSLAPECIL